MFYTGGAKHILSYQHSQPKCDVRIAFSPISYVVRSTISMRSMLKLGGSRGMPPRKILKITCSEIDFGGILCKK